MWGFNPMNRPLVRTLLVDDDHDVMTYLKDTLKGFSRCSPVMDWVSNGEDAIEQIARVEYDVILLDQRLGERSGIDFLPEFRRLRPLLPVIVLSNFAQRDINLPQGVSDFIAKKDITPDTLERAMLLALRPPVTSTGNMELFLTEYVRSTVEQTRELKRIGDGVEGLNLQIQKDIQGMRVEIETLQKESVLRLDAMKDSLDATQEMIEGVNKHIFFKIMDWVKDNPRLALAVLLAFVFISLLTVVISQTLNVTSINALRGEIPSGQGDSSDVD